MAITSLPRMGRGKVSEARRRAFHEEVQEVVQWMQNYVSQLGFAPVARSWLYALESEGIITKGDFSWAGAWLADRRKEGLIPFDLVGADSTRQLTGQDVYDLEATPREYINRQLRASLEQAAMYWPSSYWKHQRFYPVIWTEKLDLVKLFAPELPEAVRRFASKGPGARKPSRRARSISRRPPSASTGTGRPSPTLSAGCARRRSSS